ncbi:MAG: hypothetical protein H7061_13250 [Bdellovibrionaceae bacterium]|nr:hypothetical protein [Bdellovibrio sp.]
MKNLAFGLLMLTFAAPVFADSIFGSCVTEYPSTSFLIETTEDKVIATVINHNGQAYAPFWHSLIVTNDFAILRQKSDLVMKLEPTIVTTWNKANCKWYGDKKMACIGNAEKVQSNDITVEPWALYSSVIKDSSFAGDYEYVEMTLSFYVSDEQNQLVMKYPTQDCRLSNKKLDSPVQRLKH